MFNVCTLRIGYWHSLLLLSLILTSPAVADDLATRQLREQQQRFEAEQDRQRLQRWQGRHQPAPDDAAPPPAVQKEPHCWAISGVRLRGNQRLGDQALRDTLQPLLKPCLGTDGINRLLRAITQRYVAAGYPASRPLLVNQPQAGQALDILIIEGFVERIELDPPDPAVSLGGAFPGLLGEPLYLPDLEQGLDQLNRLRAFEFAVQVLPGQLQGGSRVRLHNEKPGKRWHLDPTVDNRGLSEHGRHRLMLNLGLDSPLGLNDELRLSVQRLALGARDEFRGLSASYTVPYGPWTFSGTAAKAECTTELPGPRWLRVVSTCNTRFLGAGIERVLWREQRGMLSLSTQLNHTRIDSAINGWRIGLQSPELLTLDTGLHGLWLHQGLWTASAGIALGRSVSDDPLRRTLAPRFTRYRASLAHRRALAERPALSLNSQLSAQYSPDNLPAAEHFGLTGDNAVRGFRTRSVSAASGLTWRNTLSHTLSSPTWHGLQISPRLSLDLGWARHYRTRGSSRDRDVDAHRLIGASAGLQLTLPSSQHVRLDYQRALYASDLPRHALEPGFWIMAWQLNL
ncbi:ShlB/FhaC/HecB family hemolysin secretion/activation protein [Pseudomonas sp. RP23018S]|uniref:ShlB/FhaC/HecB family hemolysin secretion/activation protein n=1 Tax=Pseudomonas sp. RP23018S TaxID=3096037 RepID=UPI002ACAF7AA|nr:ShlB/FhaC/HecB family hemolysin secretion/activation protein [Pseudomonas sp. RP23018S]MDZ5603487.1 ShlB/FhaC/HecB family hemolysin secretion/activation protein [Pseudomonas sp. RP23018S]